MVDARSRTAQFHCRTSWVGVASSTTRHNSASIEAGASAARAKYRRYTRAVTPSTTGARLPKATANVAFAAYGPTAGSATRSSKLSGTDPRARMAFASALSNGALRIGPSGRITDSIDDTRARESALASGNLRKSSEATNATVLPRER